MAEADGAEEVSHFARGGLAEAEFGLVGGERAGGGDHDFLVEVGVGEAEGLDASVDGVDAEAVDGEVGGGVVGDDDHEGEDVFEVEGDGGVEEGEEAGAGDGFVGVEGEGLVPAGAAGADLGHGVVEDGEFDDGGGLDGEVGVDADGLGGGEVEGVEGGVAGAGGGAGGGEVAELLLEGCLGGEGGGGAKENGREEQAGERGGRPGNHCGGNPRQQDTRGPLTWMKGAPVLYHKAGKFWVGAGAEEPDVVLDMHDASQTNAVD